MKQSSLARLQDAVTTLGGELVGDVPATLRGRVTIRCGKDHSFVKRAAEVLYRGSWCPHCAGNARGTLDAFQSWASSHGGECLSERYVSSGTALRFRCKRGHEFASRAATVTRGRPWCGECLRLEDRMARFEKLRARVECLGYEMLSTEYVTGKTPLHVRCDRGHEYLIRPDQIVPGRTCPVCRADPDVGDRPPTAREAFKPTSTREKLEAKVAERGGSLLSSGPITSRQLVTVRCRRGHEFEALTSNVVRGSWCPHCNGNARGTLTAMQELARSFGGTCTSRSYVNNKTPLSFRCRQGHEFMAEPREFTMGRPWCGECIRVDYQVERFDELRDRVRRMGYEMLSERLVNHRSYLKVRCDQGHLWRVRVDQLTPDRCCPECRAASGGRRPVGPRAPVRRVSLAEAFPAMRMRSRRRSTTQVRRGRPSKGGNPLRAWRPGERRRGV